MAAVAKMINAIATSTIHLLSQLQILAWRLLMVTLCGVVLRSDTDSYKITR